MNQPAWKIAAAKRAEKAASGETQQFDKPAYNGPVDISMHAGQYHPYFYRFKPSQLNQETSSVPFKVKQTMHRKFVNGTSIDLGPFLGC